MGESTRDSRVNLDRQTDLVRLMGTNFDWTMVRGFYGGLVIRIHFEDGTLQEHMTIELVSRETLAIRPPPADNVVDSFVENGEK